MGGKSGVTNGISFVPWTALAGRVLALTAITPSASLRMRPPVPRIPLDLERPAASSSFAGLFCIVLAGTLLTSVLLVFHTPPCSPSQLPPHSPRLIRPTDWSSCLHSQSHHIYLIASAFGSSYLPLTFTAFIHPLSFNFGHIALSVTFVVVPARRAAPPPVPFVPLS